MDTLRVIYQGINSKGSGVLGSDYADLSGGLRITWPPIHSTSIVLISASQCRTDNFERFIGDAPITVQNIAPQEGFVDFWIYVNFEKPVDVAVDLVVLDPPSQMVVVDPDFQNQKVYQVEAVASVKPKPKRKSG
jgi:hypothetical protein